jgi:hypothetical protein
MRKTLIYSIIAIISIISVFLANYAMVFHLTAKIVSSIAILISLVHLLLAFIHPNGWEQKEKYFLGMWIGPLLFSIHQIISPVSIMLLLWSQPSLLKWMKVDNIENGDDLTFFKKWKKSSVEMMWISFTFWGLDLLREYTIWHELNFRVFPTILVVAIFLNWIIFRKKIQHPDLE